VEAQTRQALRNLKGIVEASGSQVGKIVKTTVRPLIDLLELAPVRETFDLLMPYTSRSS
jgi:hypothetical protein